MYSRFVGVCDRSKNEALLPKTLPEAFGMTFDVAYRAAEDPTLAGGDWYDAFTLPDGRVAFSVGDVSGQGAEAAIVTGHVRELLRVFASQGACPHEVLGRVNRAILATSRRLTTAFIAFIDPLTLAMEYASAGHVPPLLVQSEGTVDALDFGDVALGVSHAASYSTHRCAFAAGSAVVLYTDGLIQYRHNVPDGERRLRVALRSWANDGFRGSAEDLANAVLQGERPAHDVAVLAVRARIVSSIHTSIRGTIGNARRGRNIVDRVLAGAPFGARRPEFVLAMSEAINNAVEHGCPAPTDQVRITLDWDRSGARGSVISRGSWRPHVPSDERGHGLSVMRALTDRMQIDCGHGATIVRLGMDNLMPEPVPHGRQ